MLPPLLLATLLAGGAPLPFDADDVEPAPLPARAADLTLRPVRGNGRPGRVWVRPSEAALVVQGEVEGPAPAFADREEHLAARERIELSLAGPRDPALPPGPLRTLFVRRWVLSGPFAAEDLAAPAFARLPEDRRAATLEPQVLPAMRTSAGPDRRWRFEIRVPWAALPPLDALAVRELRVAVEVAGPGAARSATAPGLRPGVPATFSRVRLPAPRAFGVTRCDEPLAGAWFVPPPEGDFVEEVIVLGRRAPRVRVEPRSHLAAGPDTWVCLPRLAVQRAGRVLRLGLSVGEGVTLKRIAGGSLLLAGDEGSLLVAPDWSRIEVLDLAPARAGGAARAVRALCLRGGRYEACRARREVDAPFPPR